MIESLVILNNRYQIIKLLAESQYTRTYLAKDSYRFDELCVIKALIDSEECLGDRSLLKTQFKQEAQTLYQLNHPQIPRFREIFSLENSEHSGLYYVRDYIPGFTYRELLNLQLSQQKYFSEAEIIDLLKKLLPVIDYLHSLGVYHHDISLDNLVCRQWDHIPFLIDFSQVQTLENSSLFPSPGQDLTQLAITLLSLSTGKEPTELFEGDTRKLREEIPLSDKLKQVFHKMVTDDESDRFTTAQDAIVFLDQPDQIESQLTVNVLPSSPPSISVFTLPQKKTMVTLSRKQQSLFLGCLSQLGLVLAVSLSSGVIGWVVGKTWLKPTEPPPLTFEKAAPSTFPISSEQAEEWERKAELRKRRQELGINHQFFQMLVDQIFISRYPEFSVKANSTDPLERKEWQKQRDELATELIETLSSLSEEAKRELGSFDRARRQELIKEANELHLSSRSLYDLANAEFAHLFPNEDKDNLEQATGQVLSAMLLESLRRLQSEEAYEKISEIPLENEITRQGTLNPGQGKAYVVQLEGGQEVEFQVSATLETQLSIYSPSGRNNLLEDSSESSWSGKLPESGFYEITIVSESDSIFDYQFNIRVLSDSTP